MVILGLVFWTSSRESGFWKKFYGVVPSLLLCYFIPSLLTTMGLISDEVSNLYFVASRFLLPTSKAWPPSTISSSASPSAAT